ncbi:hypothetical protein CORC01_08957 [Colletotrichum orchidophilum]|uniref:Uncharacterized protein n=1 Tax=Colletotrichum orchidophilum TaxID=1209926 RepID=A0A1G4B381_9PEZI|nr:uncharacterized protein CORC01_08957 [Colletotrichum orchidophilum]OHE95816.1 hypothetical protein CORC01_08957 [Colletotrichum orchidophilum]
MVLGGRFEESQRAQPSQLANVVNAHFCNSILQHNSTVEFLVRMLSSSLPGAMHTTPGHALTSTPDGTTREFPMLERSFRAKSCLFVTQHAAQQFLGFFVRVDGSRLL